MNRSIEVKKLPLSVSVVKVCARGSRLGGGGGGGRTLTRVCVYVSTIPLVRYVVSPLLIKRLPGNGVAFVSLDVSLNDLVPTLNLKLGTGVANGFLNQNAPNKSPNVSATNLTLEIVA